MTQSIIKDIEFITCPYCDYKHEKFLTWSHLKKHGKTLDNVRNEFPDHPTMTLEAHNDRQKAAKKSSETHNMMKKISCIHCKKEMLVKNNESNTQACQECLDKGLENPDGRTKSQAEKKRQKTLTKKYGEGITNIRNIPGIIEKTNTTCEERYGGVGFASKDLAKKTKKVIKEKYGSENIMQTEEGYAKFIKGIQKRFGKDITNPQNVLQINQKMRETLKIKFKNNFQHSKGKSYVEIYGEEKAKKLVEQRRIDGAKGYEMAPQISKPQKELYKITKEIIPEARLEFGQNIEYDGQHYYYFLDIAIYELKICIEYDGSFWHNEENDKFRDKVLESFGWKIIRFVDYVPTKEELEEKINEILNDGK